MLDQNTDRMWYVIGAVLVGAAIILIANSTMPEIFASVTDNFENVVGSTVSSLDSLVEYSTVYSNEYFINNRESSSAGTIGSVGSIVEKNIKINPGETYVIRYNKTDVSKPMHIFSHPKEVVVDLPYHNQVYTRLFSYGDRVIPENETGKARHVKNQKISNVYETDDFVRVEFTAGNDEHYLTLTHGNIYGLPLKANEVFKVEFSNIEVLRK